MKSELRKHQYTVKSFDYNHWIIKDIAVNILFKRKSAKTEFCDFPVLLSTIFHYWPTRMLCSFMNKRYTILKGFGAGFCF